MADLPERPELCVIIPRDQNDAGPIVFGMGVRVSGSEIITAAHVINNAEEDASKRKWPSPRSLIRLCFIHLRNEDGQLLCVDGTLDETRWFPPRSSSTDGPQDIAVVTLSSAVPRLQRVPTFRHPSGGHASMYGIRMGRERASRRAHEDGELVEGHVSGRLRGGVMQFVAGPGPQIDEGFSGTAVYQSGSVVGLMVRTNVNANGASQFVPMELLEIALRRSLDSMPTAIRKATEDDCKEISFLRGARLLMSEGGYRQLTVRRKPTEEDRSQNHAIENRQGPQGGMGRSASSGDLRQRVDQSEGDQKGAPFSLDDCINEMFADHSGERLRALLLTGEPGGGKTTTGRNIAWRIAVGQPPFDCKEHVPLFIRLKDWQDSGLNASQLAQFLADVHLKNTRPGLWPDKDYWAKCLEGEARSPSLFLVFDGLDELSFHSEFAARLLELVRDWSKSRHVILVTCRIQSLSAYANVTRGIQILHLEGLAPTEVRGFIERYPGLKNPREVLEYTSAPAMTQLRSFPFLLDVVCSHALTLQGPLPECRSQLIDIAIRELISRQLAQPGWSMVRLVEDQLTDILAKAVWRVRRENPDSSHAGFSVSAFRRTVSKIATEDNPNDVTNFLLRLSFLSPTPGNRPVSDQLASFSHRLFFDFLAARGLALAIESEQDSDAVAFLEDRLVDPNWSETIYLLPSQMDAPRQFYAILCSQSDDILRRRATLMLRSLGELSNEALEKNQEWIGPLADACWAIAQMYGRLGVTDLVQPLIEAVPVLARVRPSVISTLADDLKSSLPRARLEALSGLDHIGASAMQVGNKDSDALLENLLNTLGDRDWALRKLAGSALAKLGAAAAPKLTALLQEPGRIRWYELASACEALGLLGTVALGGDLEKICRHLQELLDHEQPLVRAGACKALGALAPDSSPESAGSMVISLTRAIGAKRQDATVRAQACFALGKCGRSAAESSEALAALFKCLRSEDTLLQKEAKRAIDNLAPLGMDKRRLFGALRNWLKASLPTTRSIACQMIGGLHSQLPRNHDALAAALLERLNDEDTNVSRTASEALCALGIRVVDPAPIRVLLDRLHSPDWYTHSNAAAALSALISVLDDAHEILLPSLRENLHEDKPWHVRAFSCEVLGKLGQFCAEANPVAIVTDLTKLLQDPHSKSSSPPDRDDSSSAGSHVAVGAIKGLKAIGEKTFIGRTSMTVIVDSLEPAKHWQVRLAACEALGDMKHDDQSTERAISGLLNGLHKNPWFLRAAACRALSKLAPHGASGSAAQMVACVLDPQLPVRSEAVRLIERWCGAGSRGIRLHVAPGEKKLLIVTPEKTENFDFALADNPLFALSLPGSARGNDWSASP